MALEDKDLPEDKSPDPKVAERINNKLSDGRLPCGLAFSIADTLDLPPLKVGRTADLMGIRLSRCQLGFFGYPNKQAWDQADFGEMDVPEGLTEAMQAVQDDAGEVSCAELWELAAVHHVSRLHIGYLADQLGIHVTPCQLGAF